MIGEASMIRAFNRKQQDSDSKQSSFALFYLNVEKEGVEDIMEKIDLSIVFEYQHVFEHVGKLHEFKRLYIERREVFLLWNSHVASMWFRIHGRP